MDCGIPKRDPKSYLVKLMNSKDKFVLVEGKTDCWALKVLFEEFQIKNIKIDKSNLIRVAENEEPMTNRERTRKLCKMAQAKSKGKLFGFIDREFDGFESKNNKIIDKYEGHRTEEDCIVYTRGHSIENYFFNPKVLRKFFRQNIIDWDDDKKVLSLIEYNFEDIVRIMTLITEISRKINKEYKINLDTIESSLDDSLFAFDSKKIRFDSRKWAFSLTEKVSHSIKNTLLNMIISHFEYLFTRPSFASEWYVHGHIGFHVVWVIFGACIDKVYGKKKKRKTMRIKKYDRFKQCVEHWVNLSKNNEVEFPRVLINLICVKGEE